MVVSAAMNLEVPGFFKPGGGAFETENVLRRLRKNFGGKKRKSVSDVETETFGEQLGFDRF